MFVSSDRFAQSIAYSHDVVTLCEIIDPSGTNKVGELDVIAGGVSVDSTRKTRSTCSITMQDTNGDLVPNAINDILQPYSGYTLRLSRGISWRDGTSELFPLGTFMPYNPRVNDDDKQLQINIDGYDRSKIISRYRWTEPYLITSGTNTNAAIKQMLDSRMPGLRYDIEPSEHTTPILVFGTDQTGNDPWEDAAGVASADGKELFFDARDIVTIRSVPDPDLDTVVMTFEEGENCTMTSLTRQNNGDVVYTGVVVTAEGSSIDTPLRYELWRTDTALRIPYFYYSPTITTIEQAQNAAKALMQKVTRAQYGLEIQMIPDPRLEVGDVVRIKRGKAKVDDIFTIISMDIPLDAESEMKFQTSQRRITG